MNSTVASVISAIPAPAILIDGRDRIVAANRAAHSLFRPGLERSHYVTALRHPVLLDAIDGALRTGQASEALYSTRHEARDVNYRAVAAPVDMDGRPGVLLTLIDTTDLQETSQIRRDFVANVSHELKTPLTALLGFIETLKGPAQKDPAAQRRFLGIMEKEARRMNRLVQDLLSLSRVESNERVRPNNPVDINRVAKSVVSALGTLAKDAGAEVNLDTEEGGKPIPGDQDQIAQVISNLVENAIKYGGEGNKVTVAIRRHETHPDLRAPATTIEVTDTGEGFEPHHIPRLTERFYRIDDHRSREMGGTGLGLAIVKHIVNRHRGRLRIESARGRGSRFTVILPAV